MEFKKVLFGGYDKKEVQKALEMKQVKDAL